MSKKFEIGKSYYCEDKGFDPIKVIRRTEKTIWVENSVEHRWAMRIRTTEKGIEYVTDSCVPLRWRQVFTYYADDEA